MQVKITKIINAEKLKAYATACFDDNFLITGIRVIDSKNGMFVAMPSRRKNRESLPMFVFLSPEKCVREFQRRF